MDKKNFELNEDLLDRVVGGYGTMTSNGVISDLLMDGAKDAADDLVSKIKDTFNG